MGLYRPDTSTATLAVDKNGVLVASEPELNLIEGSNIALTISDNAAANRVDIMVGGTSSTYQSVVIALAPLSYWKLDETTGTVANDVNSLVNGTYTGVTLAQAPLISSGGTSVLLDSTDSITLGSTSYRFAALSAFTWVAWVNITSDGGVSHYLVDRSFSDGAGAQGYLFRLGYSAGRGGYPELIRYRNNVAVFTSSPTDIALGSTAMVAATYDGFNSRVYINGVLAATGANDTAPIVDAASSLRIGNSSDGLRPLLGLVDEVAVWNAALRDTSIATLYAAGL